MEDVNPASLGLSDLFRWALYIKKLVFQFFKLQFTCFYLLPTFTIPCAYVTGATNTGRAAQELATAIGAAGRAAHTSRFTIAISDPVLAKTLVDLTLVCGLFVV